MAEERKQSEEFNRLQTEQAAGGGNTQHGGQSGPANMLKDLGLPGEGSSPELQPKNLKDLKKKDSKQLEQLARTELLE